MTQDLPFADATLRRQLSAFITDLAIYTPPDFDAEVLRSAGEAWEGVDCLACARCCRSMSPRFTTGDIKRIALHFRLTPAVVKSRWLELAGDGTWMGRSRPCNFLDPATNKCSIYSLRPQDCAGFPHLSATPAAAHLDMHRQNLKYCPATTNMIRVLQKKMLNEHGYPAQDASPERESHS